MVMNLVPMCSRQYDRMFNTTRIPGEKGDTLAHYSDSTYVVVMWKGKFYRLGCYSKGRWRPSSAAWLYCGHPFPTHTVA